MGGIGFEAVVGSAGAREGFTVVLVSLTLVEVQSLILVQVTVLLHKNEVLKVEQPRWWHN